MPLPVLQEGSSRESLIRTFHRSALDWSRHLGEEATLSCGSAIFNAALSNVRQANRMFDVTLPPEMSPAAAVDEVEAFFAAQQCQCSGWVLNHSAPGTNRGLPETLLERGFDVLETDIYTLNQHQQSTATPIAGLTIIPARASFKHYRTLAEEDAATWNLPEIADAAMLHLDDPRYDALLAIQDGRAVATIGVLSMGETGVIEDVFVSASHRGRGIGRVMLERALEICSRAAFKHVLLDVAPDNAPALKLYRRVGFVPLGKYTRYLRERR